MQYIGIDPGLSGAIAIIEGDSASWWPMPVMEIGNGKRRVNGAELAKMLQGRTCLVAIEKVGAMPGQGVTSMFSFGRSLGVIEGVCDAIGCPKAYVDPKTWKKAILAGGPQDKEGAIHFCRMRWPNVVLVPPRGRVDHDGAADALCLAEYGRRVHGTEAA